jgi:hypothetical protein
MRRPLLCSLLLAASSLAQTLVHDGFETPGFVATDGGLTSEIDTDVNTVLSWTADAGAVAGRQALRVERVVATGTGPANSDSLSAFIPPQVGVVTAQVWVKLSSDSGIYGAWPVQLHGLNNSQGTNAELVIRGPTPVLRVQAIGHTGYAPCASTTTLPDAEWHLLELLTTGNGTDAGLARGFLDGVEVCSSTADWSNLPVNQVFVGTEAYDRAWVGTMVLDELRVSQGVPVNRLVSAVPVSSGAVGDCLALQLDTRGLDDAGVLDRALSVRITTGPNGDGGVVALGGLGCGDADGGPANDTRSMNGPLELGLRLVAPGGAELLVESPGLLGAAHFQLQVLALDAGPVDAGLDDDGGLSDAGDPDAGDPDAGEPDAGDADTGQRGSRQLVLGCGCSDVEAAPWALLAVLALTLRHGRLGGR